MKPKTLRMTAVNGFAMLVLLGATLQAQAQKSKSPYPSMAPLDQYLTERNAEIALARSAAPPSISQDAEVMVLGRHGYETAVKGKNGFVCIVERSWTAGIDDPDFWNQTAGPDLLQSAGRTILPSTHHQENRVGIVWTIQSSDVRGSPSRFRPEGMAAAGIQCDVQRP
jgi:hypothetical protein